MRLELGKSFTSPRDSPMQGWLSILIMIALGAGFALVSVLLSSVLGPRKPTPEKSAPYECGMPPVGDARERQSVKFYLVAMIFLLFDIEVAFLYPWAMALRDLGWAGFVQVVLFMVLLLAGYVYVWRKGALDWGNEKRRQRSRSSTDHGPRSRVRNPGPDDDRREDGAVGAPVVDLAGDLRPRVLRHRDDGDELLALRHRALRRRGVPRQPAPVGPDDRRRPPVAEDGAGAAPHLRPDARAEVGHLDGRLRVDRRRVRQLRARAGRRSGRAGRRLRARAARRVPSRSSTASSSSSGRSRSRSSRNGRRRARRVAAGGRARRAGRSARRASICRRRSTCRATSVPAVARALRDRPELALRRCSPS